jgi:uncharacterized membrane protein YuzA (DUF378 family)
MRIWQRVALFLVIIGAINWGLIGFFQFDLVAALFGGQSSFMSRIIYALVGLSGLVSISLLFAPTHEEEVSRDLQGTRNVNYATEFGEETDLSDLKRDERDE